MPCEIPGAWKNVGKSGRLLAPCDAVEAAGIAAGGRGSKRVATSLQRHCKAVATALPQRTRAVANGCACRRKEREACTQSMFQTMKRTFHGLEYTFHGLKYTFHGLKHRFCLRVWASLPGRVGLSVCSRQMGRAHIHATPAGRRWGGRRTGRGGADGWPQPYRRVSVTSRLAASRQANSSTVCFLSAETTRQTGFALTAQQPARVTRTGTSMLLFLIQGRE